MIILYIAQSIDGFVARTDGSVDWLDPFNDLDSTAYTDFINDIDVILMGRKSYDQTFSFGFWPYAGKKCYVFSSDVLKTPPENADVTKAEGDIKTFVSRTCQDKRVWLLGGAALVKSFLEAKAIDEFIISIVPVTIGTGIRLFLNTDVQLKLKCTKSTLMPRGIVENHYKCD